MPQPREFEINDSTVQDTNVVQGDSNRTIQGQGNQAIIGDNNVLAGTVVVQNTPSEKRPSLERTLLDQVTKEVSYRQEHSLHNQVFIELGKTQAPEQVSCPWAMEIKVGKQKPEPIPDGQTITQVFERRDIAGKLLILGHPGAGKTTTMLALAKDLVAQAQQDPQQPIPVLFNLSSWRDNKQSIAQWLVKELREKYRVRESLGQTLLDNKKLLPLLDGLDELAAGRQETCAKAINRWLESEQGLGQLVVCSRVQEYTTYKTVLALNGTICLLPLKIPQIEQYLQQTGKLDLWPVVSGDKTILEMVRVPLWLSVLTLARDQLDLVKWRGLVTDQERLTLLLDAYVSSRLHSPLESKFYRSKEAPKNTDMWRWLWWQIQLQAPTAKQTRRWLVWLAQHIEQDEFLIEQMQPSLLNNQSEKWLMRLIWGLLWGLIVGLVIGLIVSLLWGVVVGLIVGLIWGISVGLIGGLSQGIRGGLSGGLLWWGMSGGISNGILGGIFGGLIGGLSSIDTVEVLKISFSRDS